nr:tyrosine-type recombinase/integrase [Burkholderia multivorans]
METLRATNGVSARCLEFAILTAARSGEARGARWSEIDLKRGIWSIPAERMKAKKEHRVPLSSAAIELLKAIERNEDQDLVFPSPRSRGVLSDMALLELIAGPS